MSPSACRRVVADYDASVVTVALGGLHTCVALDNGKVKCWGDNFWGQLGLGHMTSLGVGWLPRDIPTVVVDRDPTAWVTDIVAGYEHTCAIFDTSSLSGQVKCWGSNFNGELGYGSSQRIGDDPGELVSAESVRLGGPVEKLVVGLLHTCALLEGGTVLCWGDNSFGQFGIASTRTAEHRFTDDRLLLGSLFE